LVRDDGGVRFVHNQNFGETALPHFAASLTPQRDARDNFAPLKKHFFPFQLW